MIGLNIAQGARGKADPSMGSADICTTAMREQQQKRRKQQRNNGRMLLQNCQPLPEEMGETNGYDSSINVSIFTVQELVPTNQH
jgi:hypothetical protein